MPLLSREEQPDQNRGHSLLLRWAFGQQPQQYAMTPILDRDYQVPVAAIGTKRSSRQSPASAAKSWSRAGAVAIVRGAFDPADDDGRSAASLTDEGAGATNGV